MKALGGRKALEKRRKEKNTHAYDCIMYMWEGERERTAFEVEEGKE